MDFVKIRTREGGDEQHVIGLTEGKREIRASVCA